MKRVILIVLILSFLPFLSAEVICTPNSVSVSGLVNSSISSSQIVCVNDGNSSVSIGKSGDYFSISDTVISQAPAQKTITIVYNNNIPSGLHQGFISFSDNSSSVLVSINVSNPIIIPPETQGCRLIELPHTSTYRLKQGETSASGLIKVKVSSECQEPIEGMTVTEQTQMSKPMYLQGSSGDVEPGDVFSFSIGLDAIGVSTGAYSNLYIVSGSLGDEIFQKSISLSTIVTLGTSPVDQSSFTNLPSCTLDSDMALNTTYSLICNNENPNIEIEVPYNEFFKGVSVSESEGKFQYSFIPKKIGVTDLIALFKYKGVIIGDPFIKAVRIMQGNVPIQGTELNILFYQNGVKKEVSQLLGGEVTILVKDNNTDSIVPIFTAYLNGLVMNNSFKVSNGNAYELIVSSQGYLSKTLSFSVNESTMVLTLSPSAEFYYVNDALTISTDVNATLLLDDSIISSPYTFSSPGNKTLKAVKEGYITIQKSLFVKQKIFIASSTPLRQDWKKGNKVTAKLSENVSWIIEVQEDKDGFLQPIQAVASGTGDILDFKIDKKGTYTIKTNELVIDTFTSQSGGIAWYWYGVIGIVALIILVIFFKGKGSSQASSDVGFEMVK